MCFTPTPVLRCGKWSRVLAMAISFNLVVAGCSTTYKVDIEQTSDPVPFNLVDRRPEAEKKGGSRSINLPDCEWGISDDGDSRYSPPPMDLLRHSLNRRAGVLLQGKTVVVASLRITRNNQAGLRAGLDAGHTGTYLALRTALRGKNCIAGPEIIGGYAPDENPEGLLSFTVTFRGTVENQIVSTRYFYVMTRDEYRNADIRVLLPQVVVRGMDKIAGDVAGVLQSDNGSR